MRFSDRFIRFQIQTRSLQTLAVCLGLILGMHGSLKAGDKPEKKKQNVEVQVEKKSSSSPTKKSQPQKKGKETAELKKRSPQPETKNSKSKKTQKEDQKKTRVIQLPKAGVYKVKDLLPMIQKLSSRPILVSHSDALELPIRIDLGISRDLFSLEEIFILFASHRLYFHDHQLPHPVTGEKAKGPKVKVLSRDSHWVEGRDTRFTKILKVSPLAFNRCADAIEKHILSLPPTPADDPTLETISIPVRRSGTIILRSPTKRNIDIMVALVKGIEVKHQKKREKRNRLYSYRPKHFTANEIKERLFSFLTTQEINLLVVRPSTLTNLLMIKTQPQLWVKVDKLLTFVDNPKINIKKDKPPEVTGKKREKKKTREDEKAPKASE